MLACVCAHLSGRPSEDDPGASRPERRTREVEELEEHVGQPGVHRAAEHEAVEDVAQVAELHALPAALVAEGGRVREVAGLAQAHGHAPLREGVLLRARGRGLGGPGRGGGGEEHVPQRQELSKCSFHGWMDGWMDGWMN